MATKLLKELPLQARTGKVTDGAGHWVYWSEDLGIAPGVSLLFQFQ